MKFGREMGFTKKGNRDPNISTGDFQNIQVNVISMMVLPGPDCICFLMSLAELKSLSSYSI